MDSARLSGPPPTNYGKCTGPSSLKRANKIDQCALQSKRIQAERNLNTRFRQAERLYNAPTSSLRTRLRHSSVDRSSLQFRHCCSRGQRDTINSQADEPRQPSLADQLRADVPGLSESSMRVETRLVPNNVVTGRKVPSTF